MKHNVPPVAAHVFAPDKMRIGAEHLIEIRRIHPRDGKSAQNVVERRMMSHPHVYLTARVRLYRQASVVLHISDVVEVRDFIDAFSNGNREAICHSQPDERC
jgi:hypothetical protein